MASVLAWLDHDEDQRARTVRFLEQFKDQATVDEIGVAAIRDTIAGELFPGLSVLHTRARYFLLIPWLLQQHAYTGKPAEAAARDFRSAEIALIHSLLAGGETAGVIGRTAKNKLKRMPSSAYWAALAGYGLRTRRESQSGFFARGRLLAQHRTATPTAEDPGAGPRAFDSGLSPTLPATPDGLTESTTFALSGDEATYLRDRLTTSQPSSLFPWVFTHGVADIGYVWQHPDAGTMPAHLFTVADHGRRLSLAMHGAALLYNLLVAEKIQDDETIAYYRSLVSDWAGEVDEQLPHEGWKRDEMWSFLRQRNPRLTVATQTFVDRWVDSLPDAAGVADNTALRDMVATRERHLKGGRARLGGNQAGLDSWSGGSGLFRMDYNWGVARRILGDIIEGLPD